MKLISMAITLIAVSSIIKIAGGIVSGSVALVADGLDSIINVATMSMAYYLHLKSRRPPDYTHRYGHWGFEDLSSLILSLILVALGTSIVILSVYKMGGFHSVSGEAPYYALLSTGVLMLSFISFRMYGSRAKSVALLSESRHLAIDLIESIVVIGGVFLAVEISGLYDLITAVGIGFLMYLASASNVWELYTTITHEMPDPLLDETLKGIALTVEGVRDCHRVRARKMGGRLFIDLHILVDEETTIAEAHKIAHRVEEKIKVKIPEVEDVVIHIEPIEH